MTWETGAVTQARRRLARPLWRRTELAEATRALFASLLTTQRASVTSERDERDERDGREASTPERITALALTLRDLSPRPQARQASLIAVSEAGDARGRERLAEQERRERLARLMVEVGAPLTRRYGTPALYRLEAVRPDAILPEERLRLVRFDGLDGLDDMGSRDGFSDAGRDTRSRAGGTATRRAPALPDAADVTPPQPHWW